ncbi:MAG: hypothetical protein ACI9CB_002987 [Rhodothermales bacterium]|jgi:hypothetical protein
MQELEVFQSLWAMEQRIPGQAERPMEENFRMASEAGYHGLCIDPAVDEIEKSLALKPLFDAYGLKCMVNAFPYSVEELKPILEMSAELNASLVNVIGGVMPLTVAEGVPVVHQWMRDAQDTGMELLFETHRDCTLNDLHYTLQLIEQVPEMRLCADLSHYVIDREMSLPLREFDQAAIRTILERSDCFQGRVSNAEQIQVPIEFPQHKPWVDQFRLWWEEGISIWRQRNEQNARLIFLCELGPPHYAITDAQGLELSDRWEEALLIRSWVEGIWEKLSAAQI